jgi:hypothetical protein
MKDQIQKYDLSRRNFIKTAAASLTSAGIAPYIGMPQSRSSPPMGSAALRVQDGRVSVETGTLTAVIEKGLIRSLKSKITGDEFIQSFELNQSPALQIVYRGDETAALDESKFGSISCRQVSDHKAEFVFHSWDGDGVLSVGVDPASGDLLMEPSAYSSRPGVRACRWSLKGIRHDLELVAPLFQGVKLPLGDPLIRDTRRHWPVAWEAAFAILQSRSAGFWIHAQDSAYRYKALRIGTKEDPDVLGFDSEAYGPIDDNLSAGGLAWRINVYQGDWKVPAKAYRDWLWRAYNLNAAESLRKEWIYETRLALCWCPGDVAILDALSKRVEPRKVLIHFPDWRMDRYDENYPTLIASKNGREFIAKGQALGFRVMPHFNAIDMDPSNPVYAQVRDFQYRDIERKTLHGWSWYNQRQIGVPDSNEQRTMHRDKKVMIKVHPGLSMWRAILGRNIQEASQDLALTTVFIDVTLNTYNLHNCLVEGMTPTEGMKRLIEHVGELGDGLVVGGEGLNEITAQGQSFAQAHLFESWQKNASGLERTGGCALNEFLLGKLCRTVGYSGLAGKNADEELRMRIHEEHGAIPTITVRSAKEVLEPNAAVKRILDRAAGDHDR